MNDLGRLAEKLLEDLAVEISLRNFTFNFQKVRHLFAETQNRPIRKLHRDRRLFEFGVN